MLGRRNPQRSFYDAQMLPHRVPADSFYGRMGEIEELLFQDEDLAEMYCPDNGRPSLPPSLLCGVQLLQFYEDVSDREAEERVLYDLRWKVALNLPLDYAGFDHSSLSVFRNRLLENGKERYAFERFIAIGRQAGFLPDKMTLLTDTTPVKGAGAVQDTYTLIRKGIRRVLKAAGYQLPQPAGTLSEKGKTLVARYLGQDRKAELDWSDPQARAEELKRLVQDAEETLKMVSTATDKADVRREGWLLSKVLGDDIEKDDQGQVQLSKGTAEDRLISLTDPQMRYGHKSSSKRFEGFKAAVTIEQSSELIVDIIDIAANEGDGEKLMELIARVENSSQEAVVRVLGDGAFGSGENLAGCANYPGHRVDLITKSGGGGKGITGKQAFKLELEEDRATCPGGQVAVGKGEKDERGRAIRLFQFSREKCEQCALFKECVKSKVAGRSVRTHYYEEYLQTARERTKKTEFKELYRQRSRIEGKQAELVGHGLRRTRYVGTAKRRLQRLWQGAGVNLKRLFKLGEQRQLELRPMLASTI